jgi:hypothetical protein
MKQFLIFCAILCVGAAIGWLVNNHYNRPCLLMEKQIMAGYGFSADARVDSSDIVQKLQVARMYADLADSGCPEHREEYRRRAEVIVKSLSLQTAPIGVNSEIKIDMNKVSEAVNAATEKAVEAVGGFLDKMKDTKVSITVE